MRRAGDTARDSESFAKWTRRFLLLVWGTPVWLILWGGRTLGQDSGPGKCQMKPINFEGWEAEELSNAWVRLAIVPQLGGRLMQVIFGGHAYLFVNPQYKGKYFPPSEGAANGKWFNYGGDKVWPLPEGTDDEQHWPGPISDNLDDGAYKLKTSSRASTCAVQLEGPPDPRTGLQYSREISLGADSPEIFFLAVMRNISGHAISWSMQSVSQYTTADQQTPGAYNHDFWAFTPVNPNSAYVGQYYVRSGVSDAPCVSVRKNLLALQWRYLEREIWIDSRAGWIAVVDGSSHYAMIERFHYQSATEYPGKATVIFYTNGPSLEFDEKGMPFVRPANPDQEPYYMEAELNSPVVRLEPGGTYAMDTEWLPTRLEGQLEAVTDAGIVAKSLTVSANGGKLVLSGSFGVFFPGKLIAHLYDRRGVEMAAVPLRSVTPLDAVNLHQEIAAGPNITRASAHLVDERGVDRGSLGEATVSRGDGGK